MAFITQCWKSGTAEAKGLGGPARRLAWAFVFVWALGLTGLLGVSPAWAQSTAGPAQAVQLDELQISRVDDGYYINAGLQLEWPPTVEEALAKGVPLHFVARVDILRERWYWSDKEVARQERYMRLSYQPLTRRWRLLVSSQPLGNTGLGVSLGQSFDSASEALSALGRIHRWKVADAMQIEADARHRVEFSFRLDLNQLPRPLQIGILGDSDWNLGVTRSLKLTPDSK
jgi:hypothetical protein